MYTTLRETKPEVGTLCLVFSEQGGHPFKAVYRDSLFETFHWEMPNGALRSISWGDKWTPVAREEEPPTNDHGLTKYDRPIRGAKQGTIDVYAVIETFAVTCPARQHAIKKLLCSGIRGKGDALQDLKETRVAIDRAIKLQEERNG